LENATQKPEDQQQQQQDQNTDDDNEGVEMSEDFEGTLTDPTKQEEDDDVSDEEDDQDREDVADEMGDLGKKEREGLDKNMWAPEDQEEKVQYVCTYSVCKL